MASRDLEHLLSTLRESAKSAIANASSDAFDDVREYLHLERAVESELDDLLTLCAASEGKHLVLVCGNVGDGKSHLISRFRQNNTHLMGYFRVHDDATESFAPERTCIDELQDLLAPFSDELLDSGDEKVVLAINLGTLSNFLASEGSAERFSEMHKFVGDKQILEVGVTAENFFDEGAVFQFVNLGDHHLFHLTEHGPVSESLESVFDRITTPTDRNPFYQAYLNTPAGCIARANFEFLQQPMVQRQLSRLLIACMVKQRLLLSVRALYSFIYDLLIPVPIQAGRSLPEDRETFVSAHAPNYLFDHPEVSPIFAALHELDPARRRSEKLDELVIHLGVTDKPLLTFNDQLEVTSHFPPLSEKIAPGLEKELLIRTFLRVASFVEKDISASLRDPAYDGFMLHLYNWNCGNKSAIKDLWKTTRNAIYLWNGKSPDGHINLPVTSYQMTYRVSEHLEFKLSFENIPPASDTSKQVAKFSTTIPLTITAGTHKRQILIDCRLYELFVAMEAGYHPSFQDKAEFLAFSSFVDELVELGDKGKSLYFNEVDNDMTYLLKLDDFDDVCFIKVSP